jgi:hypothetical protein
MVAHLSHFGSGIVVWEIGTVASSSCSDFAFIECVCCIDHEASVYYCVTLKAYNQSNLVSWFCSIYVYVDAQYGTETGGQRNRSREKGYEVARFENGQIRPESDLALAQALVWLSA